MNIAKHASLPFALPAALLAAPLVAQAVAQAVDAPPTVPTGLVANPYGPTAGGVRWERSSDDRGAVRGYEIVRNGVVLGVRDTLSVVERDLSPGTAYAYDITAIDGAGQRSGTASVTLTTPGDTPSPPGPSAPAGLRADVYSRTAAELFWARSPDFGLRYEIRRDGAVVATNDGTSYFDDALASATTYAYDVVAIDREGRRSSASTVELTTRGDRPIEPPGGEAPFAEPNPDAATLVARLGYPAALALADDLVSMSYLTLYYDIDRALARLLSPGANYAEPTTRSCPGGGTASGLAQPFLIEVVLDGCTIEGRTLSGELRREADFTVFGAGARQEVVLTFDDLSIEAGAEGSLRLSGTSTRNDGNAVENSVLCSAAPRTVRGVDNRIDAARLEVDGVVRTIAGAHWAQTHTTFPAPVDDAGLQPCTVVANLFAEGAATVESARFGPAGAALEKAVDIVRDPRDDPAFSGSARLGADFGDGSTFAVTAIPGLDGEAQVDIVADGAALSFTDDYRFEAREDIPTIVGD